MLFHPIRCPVTFPSQKNISNPYPLQLCWVPVGSLRVLGKKKMNASPSAFSAYSALIKCTPNIDCYIWVDTLSFILLKCSRNLPWLVTFCTLCFQNLIKRTVERSVGGRGISLFGANLWYTYLTILETSHLACRASLVLKNTIREVLETVVKFSSQWVHASLN